MAERKSNLLAKSGREHDYFPTDPAAVFALRKWLERHHPAALRQPWEDPCGGFGGLIEGLVPVPQRHVIELQPRLRAELVRRVPKAQVRIGDGLALPWTHGAHIAQNPPFTFAVMTAFARRAIEHRHASRGQAIVCTLALSTWWHSEGATKLRRELGRPDWVLGMGFRISCDGSGVGDMRSHDWLVWDGSHSDPWSRCLILDRPAVDAATLAEHSRLSRLGA